MLEKIYQTMVLRSLDIKQQKKYTLEGRKEDKGRKPQDTCTCPPRESFQVAGKKGEPGGPLSSRKVEERKLGVWGAQEVTIHEVEHRRGGTSAAETCGFSVNQHMRPGGRTRKRITGSSPRSTRKTRRV